MSESPIRPPIEQPRVVSADSTLRVLLAILAAWTFFAGLALFTQGVGLLSYGDADHATQRILGAHLLIMAPMYVLLAWRPVQYRLLGWTPYAGQLAIVLPTGWDLVTGDREWGDGALIFVVSAVFLGLLVYMRFGAHAPAWFEPAPSEDEDAGEDEAVADDDEMSAEDEAASRARRYRRS